MTVIRSPPACLQPSPSEPRSTVMSTNQLRERKAIRSSWSTRAVHEGFLLQILTATLTAEGVPSSKICNFVAFRPSSFTARRGIYNALINGISGIEYISLVFLLTVTDESTKNVLPSSGWDKSCKPLESEVRMIDAVDLIASVSMPSRVKFTLAVSLRFDTFDSVGIADLGHGDVNVMLSSRHSAGFYERECEDFFQHDPKVKSAVYFGGGGCMFAPKHGTRSVVSFETPGTLRNKMVAVYRRLGWSLTAAYVIGWSVFNVTRGLAPQQCNGPDNRIKQIRKVLDNNI
ncbi:uncharacterized protein LOC119165634 [Rhipicephalus microplus]|uniref:uncharacterized protein LOC119165634 n=1 Tax=Rhipicephalus microplus TaxID=6941 RepID=UPI003F6D4EFB